MRVRLWGTPARLEEMLKGVPREVMTRKPGSKWSAQEHAGHLADLEPLWFGRVDDFLADSPALTMADVTNRKTDEANHNAHSLQAILGGFRAARMRLLDRVGELKPEQFSDRKLHSRLKQPMRLVDHLFFVAEHDDHHLATIWKIISEGV